MLASVFDLKKSNNQLMNEDFDTEFKFSVSVLQHKIDNPSITCFLSTDFFFPYLSRPMGKPTICIGENKGELLVFPCCGSNI